MGAQGGSGTAAWAVGEFAGGPRAMGPRGRVGRVQSVGVDIVGDAIDGAAKVA